MSEQLLLDARCKVRLVQEYLRLKEETEESCSAHDLGGMVLVLADALAMLETASCAAPYSGRRATEVSHERQ